MDKRYFDTNHQELLWNQLYAAFCANPKQDQTSFESAAALADRAYEEAYSPITWGHYKDGELLSIYAPVEEPDD